jgi:hypothetical protein
MESRAYDYSTSPFSFPQFMHIWLFALGAGAFNFSLDAKASDGGLSHFDTPNFDAVRKQIKFQNAKQSF